MPILVAALRIERDHFRTLARSVWRREVATAKIMFNTGIGCNIKEIWMNFLLQSCMNKQSDSF
jgi:hypothetical protein